MKILLTGANGQLGQSLTTILPNGPDFYWIRTDIQDLDISNLEAINRYLAINQADAIVNCAAYTAVDRAEEEPELASQVNTIGPANLANAAFSRQIPLIHISTDYVFPGTGHQPYRESDPNGTNTVYGRTKLEGEEAVRETGGRSVIIRTSWLYSEFGHNFVRTMLRLGQERDSIGVVNDQRGCPTYAADLAQAVIRVLKEFVSKPEWPSKPIVYHFCNSGEATWYDMAAEVMHVAGLPCAVIPVSSDEYPQKAKRPAFSVMDNSLFSKTFNFEIAYWKESLTRCLRNLI